MLVFCSHNQLADLGEGLGALENLQCLRVDHNQFRHLHDDITMLSHLEQLVRNFDISAVNSIQLYCTPEIFSISLVCFILGYIT